MSDRVKLDADLIWPSSSTSSGSSASSSWIPRSLTANLTLNFMGQDVDLAEVGVRSEGLEFLVEDVVLPLLGKKQTSIGPKRVSVTTCFIVVVVVVVVCYFNTS